MDRIKGAGHVNNRFVSEDAQAGRPPTELTAEWFNNVQEEICAVIEKAGITLNENDQTQLLQAINKMIESLPIKVMTGATSESSGTSGMVPPPEVGDENKVLTGSGEWKYLSGISIGQEVMHYGSTPPPGCLICDGSEVGRTTYPELYEVIGTTYGEGDGETTFNLPDRIGRFGQGSLTPGQYIEAGLPNITGDARAIGGGYGNGSATVTGCFETQPVSNSIWYEQFKTPTLGDPNTQKELVLNASLSSAIYGKSDTVQPPAITQLPCIKAFDAFVNPGLIDITELANEIAGKVDKVVNGKTIAYIVDSYHDEDGNWYRKWSDGWLEQGGTITSAGSGIRPINFNRPTVGAHVFMAQKTGQVGTSSNGQVVAQVNENTFNFNAPPESTGLLYEWHAYGMEAK